MLFSVPDEVIIILSVPEFPCAAENSISFLCSVRFPRGKNRTQLSFSVFEFPNRCDDHMNMVWHDETGVQRVALSFHELERDYILRGTNGHIQHSSTSS